MEAFRVYTLLYSSDMRSRRALELVAESWQAVAPAGKRAAAIEAAAGRHHNRRSNWGPGGRKRSY